MMPTGRSSSRGRPAALLVLLLMTLAAACGGAAETAKSPAAVSDPLAAEIEQAAAFLQSDAAAQGPWAQSREGSLRELGRAQDALRAGRRTLAMFRFSTVKANLATAAYLSEHATGKDMAAFEAEWKRMGGALKGDLGALSPAALDGVHPAAVRAVGETALPQIRGYYEASLDYGRSTAPAEGLYYLASAQAQRDLARFARTLSAPASRREPPLRSIAQELDALESEMLAAYRPPASIEKHPQFIAASSALKEARELDAAGLCYGALLRYLQAAVRFAPLRQDQPALSGDALARRLGEFEKRLAVGDVDHSLGQLFAEIARSDIDGTPADTAGTPSAVAPIAAGIAADVLPRYFAAIEPARPAPARPAPKVTVTLVRWPFT
ncbi:MAG TPA: hypothetical protein VEL74_19130 [Thermoanaerobaculia bacterium]|nr:hypothetical protein [Thermoanaerobaculia bacterium]